MIKNVALYTVHFLTICNVFESTSVGHIVGLGDRHVQNILIDKATSELIHIDLGVAFDQVLHCDTNSISIYSLVVVNCE